jgi:hypothetical protein
MRTAPNKAVEPTPYSVRYAPASGRGSPRALGRITKAGSHGKKRVEHRAAVPE